MTELERFMSKVDKTSTCWLWTGAIKPDGYPVFSVKRRPVRAHRWIYEQLVGPIPDTLDLDHVRSRGCTHRHCVNPDHLEPVTRAENIRRALPATKTSCVHGHDLTEANTYIAPNGRRRCRTCKRNNDRRYARSAVAA